MTSPESLSRYMEDLTSPACVEFCSRRSGIATDRVHRRLFDYAGEVAVGARLLEGIQLAGRRVLEVGAGLGLLACWLERNGVSVVLLEPGAGGFDENRRLMDATLEWLHASDPVVLPIRAEELDIRQHGSFDVIYSVNVLEHIPRLEAALSGMLAVLAPGGLMRHTCPNYAVPYEPHYGIPLIPLEPALTGVLLGPIAREELWQSFNFVSYRRVVDFCRAQGLDYRFDKGLLADAFARLDRDPAFRARRGPMVRVGGRLLRATGLLSLLSRLPPRWATPMAFSCWRRGERQDASVSGSSVLPPS